VIRYSKSGPSTLVDELEDAVRSHCSAVASPSGSETEYAREVVISYQFYDGDVTVVGELNREPGHRDEGEGFDEEAFNLFLMTGDWT